MKSTSSAPDCFAIFPPVERGLEPEIPATYHLTGAIQRPVTVTPPPTVDLSTGEGVLMGEHAPTTVDEEWPFLH